MPGARPERQPARAERPQRDRAERQRPERGGDRARDRGPRYEAPPPPQDERSIELGAAFREAQAALRDAKKALEKRKAEFGDEPEWLLEQLEAAEQRFAKAATEWHEHLLTTGRRMARR